MRGWDVLSHEELGEAFCRGLGLPERIYLCVRNHVNAKRFLCGSAGEDGYYQGLSEASKTTLRHQGDPMSEGECESFRKGKSFEDFLKTTCVD